MAATLWLYLWPITLAFGLGYRVLRWTRRDLVLHLAFFAGIGLTLAVVVCLGFWIIFGGWGPPNLGILGTLGFIGGIAAGLGTFRRGATV